MSKVNKVIAYALLVIAAVLVIAAFFKGMYLFFGACLYVVLAMCFMDTAKNEEEVGQ